MGAQLMAQLSDKTNPMRILDRAKIPYRVLQYDSAGQALDAVTVAQKVGESAARVYKTLVLCGSDRAYYVCVIPGPAELDLKAAAVHFGVKSLQMAPVDALKQLTGYVRGGCSPIGMKKPFPTALDQSAQSLDYILVSAGRIGAQLKITPGDLRRACLMQYAPLARPSAGLQQEESCPSNG